jgi:multiple sugar transport system permease protein
MRRPPLPQRCLRLLAAAMVVAWSAAPIALVVLSSFKQPKFIFEVPYRFVFVPVFDNYLTLWRDNPAFFRGLVNSAIIAAGATALAVTVSFLAGYVYARFSGRFFRASAFFMLLVRMLPPIVVTVPLFPAINLLRLNDTHLALILLYAAFYVSLGTWIMRSVIAQLPVEMEEAAAIDGAGLGQVLWRVILPLSAQGLVCVALFVLSFSWNEYVFGMIFTTTNARTAPVVIGELLGTAEGVQWGVIFAAATVQLLPVLVLVLMLQRFLAAGLSTGALKG